MAKPIRGEVLDGPWEDDDKGGKGNRRRTLISRQPRKNGVPSVVSNTDVMKTRKGRRIYREYLYQQLEQEFSAHLIYRGYKIANTVRVELFRELDELINQIYELYFSRPDRDPEWDQVMYETASTLIGDALRDAGIYSAELTAKMMKIIQDTLRKVEISGGSFWDHFRNDDW